MRAAYNLLQRRQRLLREIEHFRSQVDAYSDRANAQRKRCYTVALRCLKRRTDDLAKLTS